ncbi:FUSC family protein [Sciscionella marina]|uniref:FUSC family protein n=1 Tax=Sciscionella marina TaxID=508770 RepID=UPI00036C88E6|nr:FUSC family protein [Sciscionella marina]
MQSSDGIPAHWLVQLLKPKRAGIDVKRSVRAAVGIAAPIALGLLLGQLQLGMLTSSGALSATMAMAPGSYRYRARRLCAVSGSATVGILLGSSLGGSGWWTVLLVCLLGIVSAIASDGSDISSLAGLQFLVFGIVGTAQAPLGTNPFVVTGCFAVGAAWVLLLTIGAWPVHPVAPERAMVAAVYRGAAKLLGAIGTEQAHPARQELTAAMNTAYDALLTVRSRLHGRDRAYRRLLVLLTSATTITEASVALLHARHRPPRAVIDAVHELADAIDEDRAAADTRLPDNHARLVRALQTGITNVRKQLVHGADADKRQARDRRTARAWLIDRLSPGRETWLFAVRLALCLALAESLGHLIGLERSYWLALTTAIVLKPDFGSVFARAVQRGGGTVVGAALGSLVVLWAPPGWLLVLLVLVIAAMLPIGQVRNYGMFSTFVTPLVLVQQDLLHGDSWGTLWARLIHTVVGCAIVLVFGYLLWPGSRSPRLGGRMTEVIRALSTYLERALTGVPQGSAVLRRRAYRALSDLRAEFQRLLAEPSKAGRQVAAWWPAVVGLERATDAVTRCAVEIQHGAALPDPEDVQRLVRAMTALTRLVDRPGDRAEFPAMPESEQLAGIRTELSNVRSALRGIQRRETGKVQATT